MPAGMKPSVQKCLEEMEPFLKESQYWCQES